MTNQAVSLIPCGESGEQNSVLLCLPHRRYSPEEGERLLAHCAEDFRSYLLQSELPPDNNVLEFAQILSQQAAQLGVKRATLFGIGPGASVAQALAMQDSKLVRRLVLLNPTTRLLPSMFSKFIDKLERFLPLGLPLRPLSASFDSRPFLHRIDCPSLILSSPDAGHYIISEANFISNKLPNAWHVQLKHSPFTSDNSCSDELENLLKTFLNVPVKRPQKRLAQA